VEARIYDIQTHLILSQSLARKLEKNKEKQLFSYTFGHFKCPKAERIAPDKTPTRRRFNWQKV
jgi:hypothetical protein